MKTLTDYERGFLEGVIDSDGTITLHKKKTPAKRGYGAYVALGITNNSLPFLQKIQDILGTNLKPGPKKGTNCYYIRFRHGIISWLLPQLKLIVKEKRRIAALELIEHISSRKWTGGLTKKEHEEAYEEKYEQLVINFFK